MHKRKLYSQIYRDNKDFQFDSDTTLEETEDLKIDNYVSTKDAQRESYRARSTTYQSAPRGTKRNAQERDISDDTDEDRFCKVPKMRRKLRSFIKVPKMRRKLRSFMRERA